MTLEQKAELKAQRAEDRKAEKKILKSWKDFLKRMEKKDALINE